MDTSSVLTSTDFFLLDHTSTEIQQMDFCKGGEYGNSSGNAESMRMSYDLLKTITNDFSKSNELGNGTFGVVYKGALANGKQIAVKVLRDMAALDEKSFNNEFQNLMRFRHENIVHLVGYCNESEELIVELNGINVPAERKHVALCFEYIEKGSLHPFISGDNQLLPWDTCYNIIKGVCEGLKHLREGFDEPVWHLDLKPDNILLDNNMMPKIADFGLSRLIGDDKTRKTMNSVGTIGYWPPEYIEFQLISGAFDIFSLGVIIAKIMVGTKGYNECADMKPPRKLFNHVQNIWKIKLQEVVRPGSLELYCQQVKACIELASKCLSKDRRQRPDIQKIIETLNETESMMIPMIWLQTEQFDDGKTNVPSKRSIKFILSSTGDGKDSSSSYGENSRNHQYLMPRKLPFDLLRKITNGFSKDRLLGGGAHKRVYKGVYEDEQAIAVKVLLAPNISDKRLHNMIEEHADLNHENIIQLLGYSIEPERKLVKLRGKKFLLNLTNRVLCYEYVPNGSLEKLITDECHGLDWCTSYKIIKGICDGLCYLHEGIPSPIIHMNLKPSNILLDQKMVPKIGNIGLSRIMVSSGPDIGLTKSSFTPMDYMPIEFQNFQVISTQFDIFSLGVIIMKVLAGYSIRRDMSSRELIKLVVEKWRNRLAATLKGRSLEACCQQVKKCIEIALACAEQDRYKRPSIGEIVHMLSETETLIEYENNHKLLDVHPTELVFPVNKPKRHASCLLQLHNRQDDHVVFRLMSKNPRRYLTKLPLYGLVLPRCTCTLSVTTSTLKQWPPQESDDVFELHGVAIVGDCKQYKLTEYESLFNKAKETAGDDNVQEVTMKAVCALQGEAGSSDTVTRPTIEVIATVNAKRVSSIEVHPTKHWFMTNHESGNLRVWNYKTLGEVLNPFAALDTAVYEAKFVLQQEWIVAGDGDGCIHVCSYDGSQDSISFEGSQDICFEAHCGRIVSLAVHPTNSYVLSSSDDDHLIKLWQWDTYWGFESGWVCTRTLDGHSTIVPQMIFNPEDNRSFASASLDGTVKIWSLDSEVCKTMFDEHPDGLTCVDYFTGDDLEHHIITGSKDGTVQIWDLNTKRRIQNLEGHADQICVVYCNPELQKFITGSLDGTVRIWDSATYRLENVLTFNLGAVYGVGYTEDFQRIVVGCHEGISMVEINFQRDASSNLMEHDQLNEQLVPMDSGRWASGNLTCVLGSTTYPYSGGLQRLSRGCCIL